MIRNSIFFLCLFVAGLSTTLFAQMPVCISGGSGFIYIHTGSNGISNWSPSLPFSATNPVMNTIAMPSGAGGLAVSANLNSGTGPTPTFYTVIGGLYYYYDGTTWVNTTHSSGGTAAVNPGAGGGFIYNLIGGSGQVYKYDGTGNSTLLLTVPGFTGGGPYDLQVDCSGNFYILRTQNPGQWLRKYDPQGNLLQEWTLIGAPSTGAGGGFGIVGNTMYYENAGLNTGTIDPTATTINITPVSPTTGYPSSADYGSCEIGSAGISGGPDVTTSVVRGCKSAYINFHRNTADTFAYGFKLQFSGSATNGFDYLQLQDSFFIPAYQTDATLEVKPLLIANPPLVATAIIEVVSPPCDGAGGLEVLRTITVNIEDSIKVDIITPPITVCPGTPITIEAVIGDSLDFSWQPFGFIPDGTQLTVHPQPYQTTTYSITATMQGAPATCPSRTKYYTATVEPIPQLQMPFKSITICPTDSLDLSVSALPSNINYNYLWTPATYLGSSTSANTKFLAPAGDYKYVVSVKTPVANCEAKDSFTISVKAPWQFSSINPSDTTIKYGDQIQLTSNSDNAVYWIWSPSTYLSDPLSPNPLSRPLEDMVYTLIGMDEFGCKDTATVKINVRHQPNVFVPNAFSPNGDGTNDVFKLENFRFEKLVEFKVFNRWGELVFETMNPAKGWDGTIGGQPAMMDTYYYKISITQPDGTPVDFKGDVTLIR